MSWDPVWEKIFSEREAWGKYPPEELVRFVAGNYYAAADRSKIRFLELGCGPGGGPSWYIAREGFLYSGIDGSPTAVAKARERFSQEELKGEFILGYFNQLPWDEATFDCVIDIASLQHNSETDTQAILKEVHRVLKNEGVHFSLSAKDGYWGDGLGTRVDETSFNEVTEGPCENTGMIRFATRESLERLYADFHNLQFEYSVRSLNNCRHEIANWILTCRK